MLDDNFRNAIHILGQILCGDEKLFRYTGHTSNTRACKSKPARVGIWFYQAVALLPNTLPFLVSTEAHFIDPEFENRLTMADMIKNWTTLANNTNKDTVTVMDSYYLTHEATANLRESGHNVIAAVNQGRFPIFAHLLTREQRGPGQCTSAYNNNTGESLTFYHSHDKRVGRKIVYSTAFDLSEQKRPPTYIPIFDEYRALFSGCDKYNHAMHGKTFPHRCGGGKQNGFDGYVFDYMFTCSLINTHHAYQNISRRNSKKTNFKNFCLSLAQELVQLAQEYRNKPI